MTDPRPRDPASPFVELWVPTVARSAVRPVRGLDVAMGRGRHSRVMARAGVETYGVDIGFDVVRAAVTALRREGLTIRAWCADLTMTALPPARFGLIVVTRYLQRDSFAAIESALEPGGVLIFETFTTRQRAHGRGPTSADHLLEPGELASAFVTLDTLFYEEVDEPDAVARLAARRRWSPS